MRLASAPLLPLSTTFAAGILGAAWLGPRPLLLVELTGGLLVLATVALGCGHDRPALFLLLGGLLALGALRGSAPSLPHDHISRLTLPAVVSVEGRLLDEPVRWATDRTRLLLEVEAYQDGPDRRPARGRAQLTIYGETEPLGEGQRIRAEVRLHHPVGFRNPNVFDYPAHLRRDGILLVGSGRGDRVTPRTVDAPPWPLRVRTSPGCVPGGSSMEACPSSVGTSSLAPSAASGAGTSSAVMRSSPSRTKRVSSLTRTST